MRYPAGENPEDYETPPWWSLLEQPDRDAIDSLVTLRVQAADPESRAQLENALLFARPEAGVAAAILAVPERVAPMAVLQELRYSHSFAEPPMGVDVARFVVRELAPLTTQRRRLTDRETLLAAVLDVLSTGRGFVPEAGPLLAAAAERADDPLTRDLLWFAAYEADPVRYRERVLASVDSTRGYGPIVRAWMDGNGSLTDWSWGVEPGLVDSVVPFPGVAAPPGRLADYLREEDRWGRRLAPLRMRFVADGRSLEGELRQRFASDTTVAVREVIARYLESVGDTTARPWLRALLDGDPQGRGIAYRLLPADTVMDTTLVTEVQEMLIGYIAGRTAIPDTSGEAIAEPWVHDERPDLRILVSDGLIEAAIEPWRPLFQVMSMDSVEARVASDGLQMAWEVSPLTRIGERFFVSVTLRPVGERCLCGGGVDFVLERRDGTWVALSVGRWIS